MSVYDDLFSIAVFQENSMDYYIMLVCVCVFERVWNATILPWRECDRARKRRAVAVGARHHLAAKTEFHRQNEESAHIQQRNISILARKSK